MSARNLLLVDSRVEEFEQIVAAINGNSVAVVFDPASDTYASLLQKVAAQNVASFSSVGVVQHGSATLLKYQILETDHATVRGVQTIDPTLASWAPIVEFFKALKTAYSVQTVDLMACSLYANVDMVYVLSELEKQVGVNFRASTDNTGSVAQAANWTMESDNVNVKDVYFTAAIDSYAHTFGYHTVVGLVPRNVVISAATPVYPMISSSVPVLDKIEKDPSPSSLVPWGTSYRAPIRDVMAISSNDYAYAALKRDGSVFVWGNASYGGTVSGATATKLASGVDSVYSNNLAFAALKTDGSVVTWGSSGNGGNSTAVAANLTSGVSTIASSYGAFAALKTDGSVVVWGNSSYGGNASAVSGSLSSGVIAIASSLNSFAALKSDGTVVCWGAVSTPADLSGVVSLSASFYAFAALTSSGSVIAWGDAAYGGDSSSIYVYGDPPSLSANPGSVSSGVTAITSTGSAFAALKTDGSVVAWGDSEYGGDLMGRSGLSSGVVAIASNDSAFAALRSDGTVVAWGNSVYGGAVSAAVASEIASSAVSIVSTQGAFAVLKSDGSVVAWGDSAYGGNTSAVSSSLISNVVSIASTGRAFAALKGDGSVVVWGTIASYAGDVSSLLSSNVRRVAGLGAQGFAAFRDQTPDIPTGLNATPGDNQVTLSWSAPAYDGGASITEYSVYDGSNNKIESNININSVARTATHTGLTNGDVYTYSVSAVNSVGEGASGESITALPFSYTTPRQEDANRVLTRIGNVSSALTFITAIYNIANTDKTALVEKTTAAHLGNVATASTSETTQTKISNMAGGIMALISGLPSEKVNTVLTVSVDTVLSSSLTSAEKIASLIVAMNNAGLTSTSQKSTLAETMSGKTSLTANAISLNSAQTTAVLSSLTDVNSPPSTLSVVVPSTTTIPLSSASASYIVMKPDTQYTFSYSGSSILATYNSTTQKLVVNGGGSYSAGDTVSVGASTFRLFATGTAGLEYQAPPATVPDAPTIGTATPGDGQVSVTFSAPASNGGAAITSYTVTSQPGGFTATGASSPLTVTGLTNGTSYTFTVTATNSVGTSSPSSASNSATPVASGGGGGGVPCFPAGVLIRTPSGTKPVESLKTGDLVLTSTGRAVPIRMHSYSIESATKANAPYFIPAGALGPRAPAKPLHLSPLHAFQIRPNVWWNAQEAAKVSDKLEQYGLGEPITYYHVECPNFLRDNLVADGVVVESFAAGQLNAAQKHNLYKYSKAVGGFIRVNPTTL